MSTVTHPIDEYYLPIYKLIQEAKEKLTDSQYQQLLSDVRSVYMKEADRPLTFPIKKGDNGKIHYLPGYVTISEYGKKRDVNRKQVYRAIEYGNIEAVNVGLEKGFMMIHWETYKDAPLLKANDNQ